MQRVCELEHMEKFFVQKEIKSPKLQIVNIQFKNILLKFILRAEIYQNVHEKIIISK